MYINAQYSRGDKISTKILFVEMYRKHDPISILTVIEPDRGV